MPRVAGRLPGDAHATVRLVVRTQDKGLANSIRDGLILAQGRTLVVMDTDFNHDPAMIPQMVDLLRYYDLVIGSRFVMRGGMEDRLRYHFSQLYNVFIRALFQTQIQDNLSGYFAIRRERLYALAPLSVQENFTSWMRSACLPSLSRWRCAATWTPTPSPGPNGPTAAAKCLGAFGEDGQVYSKKGPAPAFWPCPGTGCSTCISRANIELGQLQGTLLFNAFITAWTAALLWLTALRLGYGDRTGLALGLLFGLSTIAWPYAKQFFGEPLSALSLLLTFYGMLAWRQHGRWPWLLVAGIGAATAVATVTAHAVLIAVWAAGGWWIGLCAGVPSACRRLLLGLGAFAAPVIVAGLLLMAYNFARFGNPFDTGYHFDSGEGFNNPLLSGLWGLLFSPYRSVLLHTPLFLASLVGFVPFLRRHRSEGSVILLLSAALILLYSAWWMWWGGFAWGPRFLVPLTPFWVLVLAPLLERPVQAGAPAQRLRTRWIVYAVATVSFVVQLAAVSVNFVNYEIALRSIYPTDWSNPLAFGPPAQALTAFFDSPVFGQFKLMQESLHRQHRSGLAPRRWHSVWLLLGVGAAAIITLIGLMTVWWIYTEDNLVDYHASWPMVSWSPCCRSW
jgi:hypothetical protein